MRASLKPRLTAAAHPRNSLSSLIDMLKRWTRRSLSAFLRDLYLRSPLPYRFPRYIFNDEHAATYGILSTAPPIFYAPYWVTKQLVVHQDLHVLFDHLADTCAYFLYCWFWWIEDPEHIRLVKCFEQEHRRRYPRHRIIHLCNTPRQREVFSDCGLNALFCNHNAFVDENIFFPIPNMPKRWDAIYDGRFKQYKRHGLAAQLSSLALIYDLDPLIDDLNYVQQVRQQFAQAHFYNHDGDGAYRKLTPSQVNVCLNECRVGLILSEVEGANYASIQYLLCGVPVVSTRSRGGRDVFFDDEYVMIVEDNAEAVRAGVEEMLRRRLAPERIRAQTLEKIKSHRDTLVKCVQRIYDAEGVPRRFASEWDGIFFNKLTRYELHSETFERLTASAN
jgi:glycosyltransferase involved in cell wall biosynthesis